MIDLATPVGWKRGRFGKPTLFIYRCTAGHTVRVQAVIKKNGYWIPEKVTIPCPDCEKKP